MTEAVTRANREACHGNQPATNRNNWPKVKVGEAHRGSTTQPVGHVVFLPAGSPVPRAAAEAGIEVTNVYRDLRSLQELGFIAVKDEYRGPIVWRQPDVLNARDAFVARAGERTIWTLRSDETLAVTVRARLFGAAGSISS